MKKLILPIALSLFSLSAYSQAWLKGGNNPSGNPFILGSNSNDPIGFETNGVQRMTILGGTGGATAGRIVIGNSIPGTFVPLARLHLLQFGAGNNGLMLRSDGDIAVNNMWQLHTGVTINSVIEKFRLTALANSNHVTLQTKLNAGDWVVTTVHQQPITLHYQEQIDWVL